MNSKNSIGQINVPLLALIAVFGIIAFLLITQSFSFKNKLLNALYYKNPSQAFEAIDIPPQDEGKIQTSKWALKWNNTTYRNWIKHDYDCTSDLSDNLLNLDCKQGFISSEETWNTDSSIIVSGSFMLKTSDPENFLSIGLYNAAAQTPIAQITTLPSGIQTDLPLTNLQPNISQDFRIVMSKVDKNRFIYYYLGDAAEPVKKAQISPDEKLSISITCQGKCQFGPLSVSGVE